MKLSVQGIPSGKVAQIQCGEPDANDQQALIRNADGGANPCRHCLGLIADGEQMLVFSYRPFDKLQPYAEAGPIFLHKNTCERYKSESLPVWFDYLDPALIRGYGNDDWIQYDTGDVVRGADLEDSCRQILSNDMVSYVHIRSKFNCFQCRVERG